MKRSAQLLLVLALLWLLGRPALCTCEEPHDVEVKARKDGSDVVLCVQPPLALDATVSVELNLQNMVSSREAPFTFDLHDYVDHAQSYDLVRLHRITQDAPFSYTYHCHYGLGNLGGHPDQTIYCLPYPGTETHPVLQGYRGTFSHQAGSNDENAIDFGMPVGTTVCAARSGVVVGVRSDSNVGGGDKSFKECANYVLIRHSDGTYGEYAHFKQNGALVKLGETVKQGQPIGLSGQTGMAKDPHLHFDVYTRIDSYRKLTYPTRFLTPEGVIDELHQGQEY